jgi:26S proteasome regulatory subunit T5
MFIGDGAKLVRDAFNLAKEKSPAIIFIDELDAIGTKRFDSEKSGDREVQRTMLELLNQLDGFSSDERIKVYTHTFNILFWMHIFNREILNVVCLFIGNCRYKSY